jgi:hypothetical protein
MVKRKLTLCDFLAHPHVLDVSNALQLAIRLRAYHQGIHMALMSVRRKVGSMLALDHDRQCRLLQVLAEILRARAAGPRHHPRMTKSRREPGVYVAVGVEASWSVR